MALSPILEAFTWGAGGSKLTPEQLAVARQLLARKNSQGVDTSPVQHWAQGAARLADALGDVVQEKRLNSQGEELNTYNSDIVNSLLGSSSPSASASPLAVAASTSGVGQEMASTSPAPNVSPEIASGIVETANALGIDPVDLGTAISYETAGTFNPTKAGPTTQWGQHKGLIQFGEPQAKQYGVDWNDPVGSQLGANGAVANYLRSTGVKPGMGMMDVYSAINAGRVGRYGASDANNGGAPGTVADKVNQQMAGHRAKAMALLGTQQQPGQAAIEAAAPTSGFRGSDYNSPMLTYDDKGARVERPYRDPAVSVQPQAAPQSGFDGDRFGNAPAGPSMAAAPEIYSAQTDFAPELPAPVNVAPAPAVASVQQPAAQPAQLPQAPSANTAVIAQALRVMGDPRANDGTRRVAQALLQQEQQKQQFAQEQNVWQQRQQYEQQQQNSDPLRQLQIQKAQIEINSANQPQRQPLMNAGNGSLYDPNEKSWIQAPNTGQDRLPDSVRALQERANLAGLKPGTPEYNQFMISGGSGGTQLSVGPNGEVSFSQGGAAKPLTESQSKDTFFTTRMTAAAPTIDQFETALMSAGEAVAGAIPGGRYLQSEEYQLAKDAGDDFVAAFLRKDSGAALTKEERSEYGNLLLPQPTDKPALIDAKRQRRQIAVQAIKSGLPSNAVDGVIKAINAVPGADQPAQTTTEKSSRPESAQSDDISRAKAAIAKGANREAVIKRLRDAGISTEGL